MWTALKVKMQLCLHHLLLCLVVVLLNVNSWCQCNHSHGRSCCMRSPVLLIRLRFCCRRATCVHNLGTSCLCLIYEVWHLCYTSLLGISFELELYKVVYMCNTHHKQACISKIPYLICGFVKCKHLVLVISHIYWHLMVKFYKITFL